MTRATASATGRWSHATTTRALTDAAERWAGARYVADVVAAVVDTAGDVHWHPIDGAYPFDWVGVEFPILGTGDRPVGTVRVFTIDREIHGAGLVVLDRVGVEVGRATFENLPAHLAAAVVVAEAVSR